MTDLEAPQPAEFLLYETEDDRAGVECAARLARQVRRDADCAARSANLKRREIAGRFKFVSNPSLDADFGRSSRACRRVIRERPGICITQPALWDNGGFAIVAPNGHD